MRSVRSVVQGTLLVGALLPGTAWAGGWYYTWSCLGACDPFPEGSDTRGPFATLEECEYVRNQDQRPWQLEHLNNTGYLGLCEWVGAAWEASPVPAPAPPPPIAAFQIGLDVGPGWRTEQAGQISATPVSVGLDIEVHYGPALAGALLVMGFHASSLSAPGLGEGSYFYTMLPLQIGARVTPRIGSKGAWYLRPNLAATYGVFLQQCPSCVEGTLGGLFGHGWTVRGGVEVMSQEGTGFGLSAIFDGWRSRNTGTGVDVRGPGWQVRASVGAELP